MADVSTHPLSTVERELVVRARGDLLQVVLPIAGQPSYVLKDPLTLEHYQLTEAEHFLWARLREPASIADLKREFERRFTPRTITHAGVQQAVNQLFEQGLLVSTAPGQAKELLERAGVRRRRERWQSLLKVLSFHLVSWDSGEFVDALYRRVGWLFSRPVALVALAVVCHAVWLLVAHGSELSARLPSINELWSPGYLLLWLATIATIKVVHELAHALACRHFGGRCHEMGVMMLAFLPALYCDVSDAWRFTHKWQRLVVSAAGMIVELVLAAAAFVGWWYTEPGLLNTWLLGVAVIGSVSTLVVNANPLLRYDGYYLLADWLEIPNLGSRAQGMLLERVQAWLLGEQHSADPLLTSRQRRSIAIYAVCARVYTVVVVLAIYAMLLVVARPYHLENLVLTLALVTVVGMALPALFALGRLAFNPAQRARIQKPRLALLGGVLAAGVAIVMFVPIAHRVEGRAVLVPADGRAIYATVAGELIAAVEPGTVVRSGDVIARLRNPQVELAVARHEGELAVKRAHFEQLNTLRAIESRLSLQLPTAQADAADAAARLGQYRRRAEELIIRSPIDGTVIAAPDEQADHTPTRLPTWSGSPLAPRNRGCWIEPNTMIGTVGDTTQLAALMTIDERDVAEVQPGERVTIRLDSAPLRIVRGKVTQVGSRAVEPPPGESQLSATRRHVVEVTLDTTDPALLVGTGGRAKIAASRQTLAALAVDFVKRKLRMPW